MHIILYIDYCAKKRIRITSVLYAYYGDNAYCVHIQLFLDTIWQYAFFLINFKPCGNARIAQFHSFVGSGVKPVQLELEAWRVR